jgi:hypothetical protein
VVGCGAVPSHSRPCSGLVVFPTFHSSPRSRNTHTYTHLLNSLTLTHATHSPCPLDFRVGAGDKDIHGVSGSIWRRTHGTTFFSVACVSICVHFFLGRRCVVVCCGVLLLCCCFATTAVFVDLVVVSHCSVSNFYPMYPPPSLPPCSLFPVPLPPPLPTYLVRGCTDRVQRPNASTVGTAAVDRSAHTAAEQRGRYTPCLTALCA